MKTYTYHKDIRRILTGIGKVLDGIVLKRYSDTGGGDVVDEIAVPVKYAPKSRVLHDLTNLSKHIQLPLISFQMKSITYDTKRTFNKIDGFNLPRIMDKYGADYAQPLPINISISVSFLSRFEGDAEQFISCVYSQFYPYAVVSYEYPELGTEIRSKFIWGGTITPTYPDDLDANKAFRCDVTADFTFEGWLFKNIERKSNRIYNIPTTFEGLPELLPVPEMNDNRYFSLYDENEEYLPDGAKFETDEIAPNTDFITVSGRPYIHSLNDYEVYTDDSMKVLQLKGNMFKTAKAVVAVDFLKSHPFSEDKYELFDFYSNDHTLSSFGCVSGVSMPFEVIDNNTMLVEVPEYDTTGSIDLQVLGEFGKASLIKDSTKRLEDRTNILEKFYTLNLKGDKKQA